MKKKIVKIVLIALMFLSISLSVKADAFSEANNSFGVLNELVQKQSEKIGETPFQVYAIANSEFGENGSNEKLLNQLVILCSLIFNNR